MKKSTPSDDLYSMLFRMKNRILLPLKRVEYMGKNNQCPVCNHYSRKFAPFGVHPRPNARCVWCGSLERHRLIWLFLQRKTDLFNGKPKKMLHFAPEQAFIQPFSRSIGDGYLTADLYEDAMVRIDITDIQYPADTFDVIYCSHVLEHIVDDVKAIRELSRVLKKDGWALIVVPVLAEKTFEDRNIVDPADRLKVFGQADHVRICGLDYANRLENNGFKVKAYKTDEIATKQEQVKFGLRDEVLYYCIREQHLANR